MEELQDYQHQLISYTKECWCIMEVENPRTSGPQQPDLARGTKSEINDVLLFQEYGKNFKPNPNDRVTNSSLVTELHTQSS